jgi:plastocyanin
MTTRGRPLATGALALAVALAPCRAGAADATIEVGHNRLTPAEVRVGVGDTVTFHNVDAMPGGHTVEASDGSFASPPLGEDESWSHTFAKPGRFNVRIREHPGATARIVVE